MTREQFLALDYPICPYPEFKRHPSTEFSEGFSIKNINLKRQLNVSWRCDGLVTVTLYNDSLKLSDRHNEVYRRHSLDSDGLKILVKIYLIKREV